ncbi:hypothetical protein AUG19_05410 [archaeon 13_1_20CM_2_54_9]|nr:MAG: hypothetical protein AUG19_05410 [archaeon 13_1_20CM_2_54_9]
MSFSKCNAYENIHNPFVYYQNIYTSPARCSRIVNANPSLEGLSSLSNGFTVGPDYCKQRIRPDVAEPE